MTTKLRGCYLFSAILQGTGLGKDFLFRSQIENDKEHEPSMHTEPCQNVIVKNL